MIFNVYCIENEEVGYIERPALTVRSVGEKFKFTADEIKSMYPERHREKRLHGFFKNNQFEIEKIEDYSEKDWQNGRPLKYFYLKKI